MILVCFAVKQEAAPFIKRARNAAHLKVVVSGMGRSAAERCVVEALEAFTPAAVVTAGFAGALSPDLKLGDVICEADSTFPLLTDLLKAGAKPARFYCAERVLTSAKDKAEARDTTGADAVEMESGWINKVCTDRKVPCATVRVILDTAEMDLPIDFNTVVGPDQRVRAAKLAGAIAKRPALIAGLVQLGASSRTAAERLAAVLWVTTSRAA